MFNSTTGRLTVYETCRRSSGRARGGRRGRAADEFHSAESVDAARLQDGVSVQSGSGVTVDASLAGRPVPLGRRLTVRPAGHSGAVHVIEDTVLGYLESLALECSDCRQRHNEINSVISNLGCERSY